MAFTVSDPGVRVGDFSLVLRNNGADVFTLNEVDVTNQEVHLGTNSVVLGAGLAFDEMFLDYSLTSSKELNSANTIPAPLSGLLPIFGAPEDFSGIRYVPEPLSASLALAVLLPLIGGRQRQRG